MRAILPAGGKGTRMAALTHGGSKEMLPLAGRPVIEWVAEEAKNAGLGPIIVVAGPEKADLISWVQQQGHELIFQPEPAGMADAAVRGMVPDEAAALLLPDTLIHPQSPMRLMAERVINGADVVLAVSQVADAEVGKYGIVGLGPMNTLQAIAEKPRLHEAPSRLAVTARYAFSAEVCRRLCQGFAGPAWPGNDASVTPMLQAMLDAGLSGAVVNVGGNRRLDCGDPEGYRMAEQVLGS